MIMLVSDGISSIIDYSKNNINKFRSKKVGFIPSSEESIHYFESIKDDYSKLEVEDCVYIDIFRLSSEKIAELCRSVDVIHLSGGDTIPFVRQLYKVYFDKIVKAFLDEGKIVVGMSAGGLILSSTFKNLFSYDDEDTLPSIDDEPFKIINYVFFPHYTDKLNTNFHPTILCPDGGLAILYKGNVEVYYGCRVENYIRKLPGFPTRERTSVHYNNEYRFNISKIEAYKTPTPIHEIIKYVNEILVKMGLIKCFSESRVFVCHRGNIGSNETFKSYIGNNYQALGLKCENDIIWMKFTTDGYLGVVGQSNDINFNIPNKRREYKKIVKGNFEYNSSGIIIHNINKTWNKNMVLIVPIVKHNGVHIIDIETAIGNYLIHKNVPILDFYGHNFGIKRSEVKEDN